MSSVTSEKVRGAVIFEFRG